MPHLYLNSTQCTVSKCLLNHHNSFRCGMLKLNAKCDEESLPFSFRHHECADHTVQVLTKRPLMASLTGDPTSTAHTYVHHRPIYLASMLHPCRTNGFLIFIMAGFIPDSPRTVLKINVTRCITFTAHKSHSLCMRHWLLRE